MSKENYNVVGVMSGTSLDGIDLAHIKFSITDNVWTFEIGKCETVAYSRQWVARLKSAVDYNAEELNDLNSDYTFLLGNTIKSFISDIENLDAVCSHGHTILHQPQNGYTLQIGNLPEIANIIGITIVCDFRVSDVKLGGQGAPLVPIGDRILFPDYDYCLNLGGFANVSYEAEGKRIAFDISAVNTVLNHYANSFGKAYDDKGSIAASGKRNELLLQQLNGLKYYKMAYPKSLGFEYVKKTLLPLMETFSIPVEDKMHTFCEHVAVQISEALPLPTGKLLITGGGAYNDFLTGLIQHHLPDMTISIPGQKILEYKEALIFALLGVLKLRGEINVLSSVTGARHDHSSGFVYGCGNNEIT